MSLVKYIIAELLSRGVTFHFPFAIEATELRGLLFESTYVSFGVLADADMDHSLDESPQEKVHHVAEAESCLLYLMESFLIQDGIEPDGSGVFWHYE